MSEEPRPFAPMPVLPLNYIEQRPDRRPGIITALGVIAIVVACLSALASAFWTLGAVGMIIRARVMSTQLTAANTASAQASLSIAHHSAINSLNSSLPSEPADPEEVVEDEHRGLLLPTRRIIVRALARHQSLSDHQQHQLHRLLGKYGRDLFPFGSDSITPKSIEQQITDAGPMSGYRDKSANYFVLGSGKLELYDDRAIFEPSSRDAPKLRVQNGFDEEVQPIVIPSPPSALMLSTANPVRTSGMVLSITECVLSGFLAIYLLMVGILVLRGNRRGRGLQRIFAWIKISVTLVGAIGWFYLLTDTTVGAGSSPGAMITVWFWVIAIVVCGCIFPIAVLIALRSRSVREYYAGVIE